MYKFPYADAIDESAFERRAREYEALVRAIEVMEAAERAGVQSTAAAVAIYKNRQLWSLLIESAGNTDSDLPDALRAQLISIGLWVLRELEEIRNGTVKSFASLIEITRIIAEGLR